MQRMTVRSIPFFPTNLASFEEDLILGCPRRPKTFGKKKRFLGPKRPKTGRVGLGRFIILNDLSSPNMVIRSYGNFYAILNGFRVV